MTITPNFNVNRPLIEARAALMQALADFRNGHATPADVQKARRTYNRAKHDADWDAFEKALEAGRTVQK